MRDEKLFSGEFEPQNALRKLQQLDPSEYAVEGRRLGSFVQLSKIEKPVPLVEIDPSSGDIDIRGARLAAKGCVERPMADVRARYISEVRRRRRSICSLKRERDSDGYPGHFFAPTKMTRPTMRTRS